MHNIYMQEIKDFLHFIYSRLIIIRRRLRILIFEEGSNIAMFDHQSFGNT